MRFIKQNSRLKLSKAVLTFLLCGLCLISVSCQTKEQKVESALKRCQDLLDKDILQDIGLCYAGAIEANPESADRISKAGEEALFKKCVEFKKRKDFRNSIICFTGSVGLQPDKANGYFQLADSFYQYYKESYTRTGQKDFDLLNKAEEALKTGLEINQKDAPAHALYGEIHQELGNFQGALEEYKRVLEIDPKASLFWVSSGSIQEKIGRKVDAVESYKKALEINPKDKTALYFLGLLYERLGKTDEAIESFKKLLEIEPTNKESLQKLKELEERQKIEQFDKPQKKAKSSVVSSAKSN